MYKTANKTGASALYNALVSIISNLPGYPTPLCCIYLVDAEAYTEHVNNIMTNVSVQMLSSLLGHC